MASAFKPGKELVLTIGLPSCCDAGERRFPLTPEAVAVLTDAGYGVRIQEGAARVIHYTDAAYVKAGAEIGSREDALSCDIVIALAPLSDSDIRKMRRGSMLLSLLNESRQSPQSVNRPYDGNLARHYARHTSEQYALAVERIGKQ